MSLVVLLLSHCIAAFYHIDTTTGIPKCDSRILIQRKKYNGWIRMIPNDIANHDEINSSKMESFVSPLDEKEEEDCEILLYEEQTKLWISDIIVKLKLCPYASSPFINDQIRYSIRPSVVSGDDLVDEFFKEGIILLESEPSDIATTMLVMPNYEGDIDEFYYLYEWLVDLLESDDEELLENEVQPAFFHPNWTFGGIPEKSAVHFEKRAPFPVINLLRREDLNSVVEAGLAKGIIVNKAIAEHNAQRLENEGFQKMEMAFSRLTQKGESPHVDSDVRP